MVSLPGGELQNTRAEAVLANVQSTSTSSHPSTAIEALSPPGSSFQASHQDALIHLRPSTAPLRTQKTIPQPLYQRNRGGPLGGQNCLGDRLETVALMFSPQDREMYWSGICTTRQDLPQPSPEVPNTGSCGSRFARLVGKFTHRGTKNRKGVILQLLSSAVAARLFVSGITPRCIDSSEAYHRASVFRTQKSVPQSLYQRNQRPDTQLRIRAFCPGIFAFLAVFRVVERNRGGPLGGQNCLGDRLETVALMFSPQDREMYWSGICTTRQDLPQPLPRYRTLALVAAVLPGSWASLPIAGVARCPQILPDGEGNSDGRETGTRLAGGKQGRG